MLNKETVIERGRNILHAQWHEILRLRRIVLGTWEPEDIHDLRVASRRFRAALSLFTPFSPQKRAATLKKSVRKLTQALGDLRNVDEALAFFISCLSPETCPDTGESKTVIDMLSDMRDHEIARVGKVLKAFKPKRLDRLVYGITATWTEDASPQLNAVTFPTYLSDTSLKLFQQLHDLSASARVPENIEARHALRIAIKKWRYFLEIVTRIIGRNYDAELDHLKNYQSILGRMNDMVEFSALCAGLELDSLGQRTVEEALRRESGLLWKHFLELMKKQPLHHTAWP